MKIKDYKCKCGHNDFFFVEKENSMGIYCSYCGKWFKWADKDERNLSMKQEQKTGEWINCKYPLGECSKCHAIVDIQNNEANYCPVCGSRNRGEKE